MCTNVTVTLLGVPYWHLCGRREKNHEKFQSVACVEVKFELVHPLHLTKNCQMLHTSLQYSVNLTVSGFGVLEVACWPLVPKFVGSNQAEAFGFFRAKKSSVRLPSEGK